MDGHERDIEGGEQEEEEEEEGAAAGAAAAAAAAGAAGAEEEEESEEEEAGDQLLPGLVALGGDGDSWLGEDKQSGGGKGRGRQRQGQQQQQQQNGAAEPCIRGSVEQQAAAAAGAAGAAAGAAAEGSPNQGSPPPAATQQPAPLPAAPAPLPSEPSAAAVYKFSTAGDTADAADAADDDDDSAADDPSLPDPSSMLPIIHTLLNCSVVVGMHPDQATEFIVALALRLGKPFAIVPCCVYHNEFQWRRLGSGQQVKNLEQLIQYVVEKDPGRVHMRRLPFEGMNRVVWREL